MIRHLSFCSSYKEPFIFYFLFFIFFSSKFLTVVFDVQRGLHSVNKVHIQVLSALVEIFFSSVGRAVAYNARGLGIESQRGHCIFWRKNMLYCYILLHDNFHQETALCLETWTLTNTQETIGGCGGEALRLRRFCLINQDSRHRGGT